MTGTVRIVVNVLDSLVLKKSRDILSLHFTYITEGLSRCLRLYCTSFYNKGVILREEHGMFACYSMVIGVYFCLMRDTFVFPLYKENP